MTKNNDLLPQPAQQPPFAVHTSHKEISLTFGWTGDAHGADINSASALCSTVKLPAPKVKVKEGCQFCRVEMHHFPLTSPVTVNTANDNCAVYTVKIRQ